MTILEKCINLTSVKVDSSDDNTVLSTVDRSTVDSSGDNNVLFTFDMSTDDDNSNNNNLLSMI